MDTKQPHELEEALDTAIARLQSGEPTESCLPADEELAAELSPLLGVVQDLRGLAADTAGHRPALRAGRERFLGEAARVAPPASREHTARPEQWLGIPVARPLTALFAPLLRRGAGTAVVLVALLAVLLTGTTMMASASVSSIPGDPLYPVKRAAESVHLMLTFDRAGRVALAQAMEHRRIREAQAVLERHRQTTVSFRAVVESFEGPTLFAAGFTVDVLPSTRLFGPPPDAGRVIAVVARTQSEGNLVAQSIDTLDVTPYPMQLAGYPTATRVQTVSLAVPAGSATPNLPSTSTLAPSPEALATTAPSPSAGATVTHTECSAPTQAWPGPGTALLHVAGQIEALEPERWHVGGFEIAITADTRLNERVSAPEVGSRVRILAIRDAGGLAVARRVVVERPRGDADEEIRLVGVVEEMGESLWRIGGQPLEIGPQAKILGPAQVGAVALMEGHRGGAGLLQVDRIRAFPTLRGVTGLEGAIEEIDGNRWVVADRPVRLAEQAVLVGEAGIGRQAQLLGYEEPDGAICALLVHVDEEAEVEVATPTLSESPMSQPSPTTVPEDGKPAPSARGGRRPREPHPTRGRTLLPGPAADRVGKPKF